MAAAEKKGGTHTSFVFIDESGFSEGSVIRRTWAPRGKTPVLRTKQRSWKRASAIGALMYRRWGHARVFLRLHRGEITAVEVRRFLAHLLRHVSGRVVVLWDGLQAHRAKIVREWVERQPRLRLVRLPAYAPELNPVEGLWAWIKGIALANVCEDTLDPVERRVRGGVRTVRRRKRLLWGFLHKTGIHL